jgi:hypothetical protein
LVAILEKNRFNSRKVGGVGGGGLVPGMVGGDYGWWGRWSRGRGVEVPTKSSKAGSIRFELGLQFGFFALS